MIPSEGPETSNNGGLAGFSKSILVTLRNEAVAPGRAALSVNEGDTYAECIPGNGIESWPEMKQPWMARERQQLRHEEAWDFVGKPVERTGCGETSLFVAP
jgi:hypothetical protein